MQKFPIYDLQSPSGQQNNCRGLDCMNVLPSLQNAERGLFRSVSSHFVGIHATPTEDYCYENDSQESGASPRALEPLLGLTPCLSINKWLQAKFCPNPNPPHHRSVVAPNEHRCPITPPISINNWLQAKSWPCSHQFTDTAAIQGQWITPPGWSGDSSAVPLDSMPADAFLPSLKMVQVISRCKLNPSHLLQLYQQPPSTKASAVRQDQVPCFSRCAMSISASRRTRVIESHISSSLLEDSFSAELDSLVKMLSRPKLV